ncbi:MAG: DUF2306 domain-containing protein [Planctomycetota bacterium]
MVQSAGDRGRRVARLWWIASVPIAVIGIRALALGDARPEGGKVLDSHLVDHVHFALGGVALLTGLVAIHPRVSSRRPRLHRNCGRIYAVAVLGSGLAALLMATEAIGGPVAHAGFGALALLWLATTAAGVREARGRRFTRHRRWMVRSYALCLAAVTLRVLLPTLAATLDDFETAYRITAWGCWVPNLLLAEGWLARRPTGRGT